MLRSTAGQGERRGSTGCVALMQGTGAQLCVIPARQVLFSTRTQWCALAAMAKEERQEAWQ